MIINLKDLIVKTINNQLVYRLVVENGEGYLEEMKVTRVPNDQYEYFIPAEISNHKGESKLGLVHCVPATRTIHPPIFVPDKDGHLVELLATGFIDTNLDYQINPLIPPEENPSADSVEDVKWSEFLPLEIPADTAYIFIPITSRIATADTEIGKYEIGLPVSRYTSDENDDEEQYFDFREFALRKTQISDIPSTGQIWYLPANIIFNNMQSRRGYLLYQTDQTEAIDVHIFDCKLGLISALNDNEALEDCGIFKDDSIFSYQLLLSDVNPGARNDSRSNSLTNAG